MADDKQQPRATDWQEELTIEIDVPRNGTAAFGPERVFLRGQMRRERLLPDEAASDEIKLMPDLIPGMRITLNGRTREGRIWDPLGLPENANLLARATAAQTRMVRQPEGYGGKVGPEPEVIRKLGETKFKSWLYWMCRLVGDGFATVVSGRLPRPEQVRALPGKTEIECWAQRGGNDRRYLEDRKEEPIPA